MKTKNHALFLLMIITFVFANLHSQAGPPWVKYNVGYNYILRGIDFPGNQDNTGYIAGESLTYQGNGIVLKTTDGGITWNPVWTGAGEGLEGSSFVDVNTGFVAGWPKSSAGWSGFGKTTDGGATWTSLPVVSDLYYFTDVVFKDASNGILFGSTNTNAGVWVTNDGGSTWTPGTGLAGVPYHGCHVSGNTYFLVDNSGHIQKSVNNGMSWSTVYSIPGLLLTGIDFFGTSTGMACGDNGKIVKTYDGGVTWTPQTIGTDIWHDFGWESQDHLFVCGTPEIVAESSDGGATWGNGFPQSALQAALYECIFTANGSGFICGSQGTLLKRAPSCTANFTASATSVCTGDPVAFTNLSTGSNLAYSWTFTGGTPSTSTLPNPVVVYNTAGSYDVKLIVNNGSWADTLLKTNYITASVPAAAPVITSNGHTLSSNASAGNQWFFGGSPVIGATGQTYTAIHSGWYWDVVTQNGCKSDTSNNIYILMTGTNGLSAPVVTISPVPGDGLITVAVSGLGEPTCMMSVFDSYGIRIFKGELETRNGLTSGMADLRSFPSGVYTVVLTYQTGRLARKVLIRK
ncbi:MAG: YCF48-related protein [Bacteroidota bacterium]